MHLVYLPVNQAWVFIFGNTIATASTISLAGEPHFFERREDAVASAHRLGLTVDKDGKVERTSEGAA